MIPDSLRGFNLDSIKFNTYTLALKVLQTWHRGYQWKSMELVDSSDSVKDIE